MSHTNAIALKAPIANVTPKPSISLQKRGINKIAINWNLNVK